MMNVDNKCWMSGVTYFPGALPTNVLGFVDKTPDKDTPFSCPGCGKKITARVHPSSKAKMMVPTHKNN